MSSLRKRRRLSTICLVLAAIVYRGLIPAGFMPAAGEAMRHGTIFVVCPHGEMGMHGHGGKGSASPTVEQCPFGAAAGPAVVSAGALFRSLLPERAPFRPEWNVVLSHAGQQHLQPPARAPPGYS
jgi:hypothetical protein